MSTKERKAEDLLRAVCTELESIGCGPCRGSMAPMEHLHGRIAEFLAVPECTCSAADMPFGRCCKADPLPAVPDLFVQWLEREMPPGTIIGKPAWWAPKLARALRNAERGVLGGCNGN